MSLAPKPVSARRRVVIARYFADPDGRLRPERPGRCPLASEGHVCRIWRHRCRPRKCGPGHDIAGFLCVEHGCSFTVYPPAWQPYGRRPLVEITPAGLDVLGLEGGNEAWVETTFGAAVDADAKRPWPTAANGNAAWRERVGREPYGVRRTQRRHIAGMLRFFALVDDLVRERPRVAATIAIDLLDIVKAAGHARDGPAVVAKGAKGAELLRTIGAPRRQLLSGFVRLGADRGYWGPPNETQ